MFTPLKQKTVSTTMYLSKISFALVLVCLISIASCNPITPAPDPAGHSAKKGENILLTTKVNPALIGGMIVSIAAKYVDMSVARKIKKYPILTRAEVVICTRQPTGSGYWPRPLD
uniref:ATP synthase subunit O, mitochondrial n=1 Tax=Cacopsylla melanoneura TaxID=428564 RepID=A0A8D9EQ75_9HEMI